MRLTSLQVLPWPTPALQPLLDIQKQWDLYICLYFYCTHLVLQLSRQSHEGHALVFSSPETQGPSQQMVDM